jgi:hypothetical protein
VACGQLSDTITITVEVRNLGDLRAGAGVPLDFYGTWGTKEQHLKDAAGDPLLYTLPNSIEPGGSVLVSVTFAPGNNEQTALPKRVRVTVDGGNQAADCTVCGAQRECNEGNNEIDGAVKPGAALADLKIAIDSAGPCNTPKVTVTVTNDGAQPASDVAVRVFAGDPTSGGVALGDATIAGPLGAGESKSVTLTLAALNRSVTIYAVVDPLDAIEECDNGNNIARGPSLTCGLR